MDGVFNNYFSVAVRAIIACSMLGALGCSQKPSATSLGNADVSLQSYRKLNVGTVEGLRVADDGQSATLGATINHLDGQTDSVNQVLELVDPVKGNDVSKEWIGHTEYEGIFTLKRRDSDVGFRLSALPQGAGNVRFLVFEEAPNKFQILLWAGHSKRGPEAYVAEVAMTVAWESD